MSTDSNSPRCHALDPPPNIYLEGCSQQPGWYEKERYILEAKPSRRRRKSPAYRFARQSDQGQRRNHRRQHDLDRHRRV